MASIEDVISKIWIAQMTTNENPEFDIPLSLPVTEFLPDETLYSYCSRTHRVACHGQSKATTLMLFGDARQGSQHDFPGRIGEFIKRTRGMLGDSANELIATRTLLGYYVPWRSQEFVKTAVSAMTRGGIGALKMSLGLPASRFRAHHPLKWCPRCLIDDKATYGVGYWHLAHQYPGVWVCLTHDCFLVESSVKASGVGRFEWYLPTPSKSYPPFDENMLKDADRQRLRHLASSIARVCGLAPDSHLNYQSIHLAYRYGLKLRDWISSTGRLRLGEICEKHAAMISLMQAVSNQEGIGRSKAAIEAEVRRMLHGPRGDTHPLSHQLFIQTLFGTWDKFWHAYQSLQSLGDDEFRASVRKPNMRDTSEESDSTRRAQLVQSMRDNQWSATRAAGEFAVSRQTAIAWATKAGLRTSKRPQVAREMRAKIITALWRGSDKQFVAEKFGVTVQTVTRLLASEVGLQAGWHEARLENGRKIARNKWLAAQRKHPTLGVKGIRLLVPSAYAWLYRNDKDWLDRHKQAILKTPAPPRRSVDWAQRDARLSALIARALQDAYTRDAETQVTLQRVCQDLPELKAKLGRIDLLPRTQVALQPFRRKPKDNAENQSIP